MGVNRIVMQNGVVWWLPPLRPKDEQPTTPPRASRPRKTPPRRSADTPRDAAAAPPPGFIPLSSLGIPGIDALILSHADFYRDAYDRAVREAPPAVTPPPESPVAEGQTDAPQAGGSPPDAEQGPGPGSGEARRPAA